MSNSKSKSGPKKVSFELAPYAISSKPGDLQFKFKLLDDVAHNLNIDSEVALVMTTQPDSVVAKGGAAGSVELYCTERNGAAPIIEGESYNAAKIFTFAKEDWAAALGSRVIDPGRTAWTMLIELLTEEIRLPA